MKINCYSCDKRIIEPGAIVFGPPFKSDKEMSIHTVHKYHICVDCWKILIKQMDSLQESKIKHKK